MNKNLDRRLKKLEPRKGPFFDIDIDFGEYDTPEDTGSPKPPEPAATTPQAQSEADAARARERVWDEVINTVYPVC